MSVKTTVTLPEKVVQLLDGYDIGDEYEEARSYYEGKADGMETMAKIISRSEQE